MGVVQKLPELLINQIAAGEVVERPASVVRELVDNSLDAGATEIRVFLEQGGQSLIRVVDNGSGMAADDAVSALLRHATSKITSLADLESVHTLGFRGEAIPSIASVSEMRLRTRRGSDTVCTELLVVAGDIVSHASVAGPVGTDIEVRKLFFNTPARRKFLRQPKTEEAKIKAWLTQISMAWPSVRFVLYLDGREVLSMAPRESTIERARQVIRGGAVAFNRPGPRLSVEGFLSHPSLAQGESGALSILVNRRLIQDRMLLRAVKDGFDSTLKDREVPLGVVRIEIDPSEVDVNVHPQKSEVRFRTPQEVFAAVRSAVREAVMQFQMPMSASPSPQTDYRAPGPVQVQRPLYATSAQGTIFSATREPGVTSAATPSYQPSASAQQNEEPFRYSALRYIGTALRCYLLCEHGDTLVVVDMHAAHERYNFNLIRKALRERRAVSQQLLVPMTVVVGAEQLTQILTRSELLNEIGIELEQFGEDSVVIRALPPMLVGGRIPALLRELASAELDVEARGRFEEWIDHCAARIACHASVRSGDLLQPQEVAELFRALDSAEFSAACPHGRPVIVSFSTDHVERWFGRDR